MPVRVLVVDDDALSREVFTLLLDNAGYVVDSADSGDAALLYLESAQQQPEVVLTDLQMPGISGEELARRLRRLCGPDATLLAMSASEPDDGSDRQYDGFLVKPFTMGAFAAAVAGRAADPAKRSTEAVAATLDDTVYRKLAGSMRPSQLEQLYTICLTDVEARVATLRRAAANGDDAVYKSEAHAIKGGCGMVGAHELQTLATSMEMHGLSDDHVASLNELMVACERLRGMLVAREIIHNRAIGVSGEDA